MGAVLREFKIPRRKVVIMTKVYRVMPDIELPQDHADAKKNVAYFEKEADSSKDHVNQWGLSRSAIFDSVEDSLQRLGTTYIDVLQIHRFDPTVPPEETMRALHDLVQSGKVRYLGASSMWAHELSILQHTAERLGLTQFSCVQIRYNLLYREEEREMIKYCNRTGVGILIWEALAAGMVARPLSQLGSSPRSQALINIGEEKDKPTEADKEIIHRVHELAQRHNWPMTSVALAWLNARVTAPVIGFNSLHAMDEVLAARGRSLTAEEERYLEEPYVSKAVFGHV
ncbi:Aryl-alcohol dehydrogenase NADP [Pyrenophora tritici-repentis]|nr:Aryl-alcohol dehydrogenase NADP [Pyrenophora tritici-repentis]